MNLSLLLLLCSAVPGPAALHCPEGFEPLGTDACLAAPPKLLNPDKVVVYFHGMLGPAADWTRDTHEFKLLGAEATRRGYALIALRGEQGLCFWGRDVAGYFCWPSASSQLDDVGRILVRLGTILPKVSERLGSKLGAPFYAGFSNGGFFVSLIASDTRAAARGYAVIHAGGVTAQHFPKDHSTPTILIGAASDSLQLPTMKRLNQAMKDSGWNPILTIREGTHEVIASDTTALFDFFDGVLR